MEQTAGWHRGIRSLETCVGYLVGLVTTPLLVLGFAKTMTAWYGGFEPSAKHATAVEATRDIAEALDRYRSRHQRMPDREGGLARLAPDYLERLPLDPWGNPFVYEPTGPLWADVLSYGADGRPGGVGHAADVSGRLGPLGPRPPTFVHSSGVVALFVIPLIGLLGARRWRWAAGMLAGTGTLWAVLLLVSIGAVFRLSLGVLVPLTVAICCMVGSVAIIFQARGARMLTFAAVLAAHLLFEHLITL